MIALLRDLPVTPFCAALCPRTPTRFRGQWILLFPWKPLQKILPSPVHAVTFAGNRFSISSPGCLFLVWVLNKRKRKYHPSKKHINSVDTEIGEVSEMIIPKKWWWHVWRENIQFQSQQSPRKWRYSYFYRNAGIEQTSFNRTGHRRFSISNTKES